MMARISLTVKMWMEEKMGRRREEGGVCKGYVRDMGLELELEWAQCVGGV